MLKETRHQLKIIHRLTCWNAEFVITRLQTAFHLVCKAAKTQAHHAGDQVDCMTWQHAVNRDVLKKLGQITHKQELKIPLGEALQCCKKESLVIA